MTTYHLAMSTGGSGYPPQVDVEAESIEDAIATAELKGRTVIWCMTDQPYGTTISGDESKFEDVLAHLPSVPYNPLDGVKMAGAYDLATDPETGEVYSKYQRYGFGA